MMRVWISGLVIAVLACGAAQAAGPMDGRWVNADPRTTGVARLWMHGTTMRAWGMCHPTLCDWGKAEGEFGADSMRYTSLITDDVGRRQIEITMDGKNTLRLRVQTRYADGRFGPEDSVEISKFRRQRGRR